MKFDVVIMNPPYASAGGQISQKIYNYVCEYSSNVVCIMPVRFLQDPLYDCKGANDIDIITVENTQILNVIPAKEADKNFSISAGKDLGIFVHNDSNTHINRRNVIENKIGKIAYSIIDKVKKANVHRLLDIYSTKCKTSFNVVINHSCGQTTVNGQFIPAIHKRTYKDAAEYLLHKTRNKDAIPHFVSFMTEKEAMNFVNSSCTKFMKYVVKNTHINTHIQVSFIPFMNDYKEPWTNERFYKYFKLTPEEIEEVENEV